MTNQMHAGVNDPYFLRLELRSFVSQGDREAVE